MLDPDYRYARLVRSTENQCIIGGRTSRAFLQVVEPNSV